MESYNEATSVSTMLTTFDNPFNPFSNYDEWWQWDKENGYNTPELLAQVMGDTSDVLDSVELAQIEATAMNIIIDDGPIEDVWTVCKQNTITPIRQPPIDKTDTKV